MKLQLNIPELGVKMSGNVFSWFLVIGFNAPGMMCQYPPCASNKIDCYDKVEPGPERLKRNHGLSDNQPVIFNDSICHIDNFASIFLYLIKIKTSDFSCGL